MIIMVMVIATLAALAVWLWMAANTPADRLARIHPPRSASPPRSPWQGAASLGNGTTPLRPAHGEATASRSVYRERAASHGETTASRPIYGETTVSRPAHGEVTALSPLRKAAAFRPAHGKVTAFRPTYGETTASRPTYGESGILLRPHPPPYGVGRKPVLRALGETSRMGRRGAAPQIGAEGGSTRSVRTEEGISWHVRGVLSGRADGRALSRPMLSPSGNRNQTPFPHLPGPAPSAAATAPSTAVLVERSPGAARRSPISMFLSLIEARTPFRRPGSPHTPARWRACSIELCQALRAELAAGRPAGEALARAISWVEFPDPSAVWAVVAAARDGGDVPAALLAVAPAAGGEGLRRLAVCWQIAVTAGASLATLVDRVEAMLRTEEAHRQEVAAQLAGPRATARLLAVLPVLGISMGAALGMNPFAFLFGTPIGLACLLAGLTLAAGGVAWTHHLVRRAESS